MEKRISTVMLIVLAVSFLSRTAIAAESSAQEIIKRSKDAMNATMQYQVTPTGGAATTVVYQKVLTNGITVSRCETSSGTLKLSYLFLNDGSFQLFPELRTAIDVSFSALAGQVPSVNPFAKISPDTVELKEFTKYEGKICYKIQAHLVSMDTNLIAMLPANTLIPDACQYLIETNNYRVIQMTMLHGKSTYISMEYKNFEALSDLPGDFFIVPSTYTIERPASIAEYSRMMMKYLLPGPKKIPKGFAFDPETHRIVKVDSKTGAFFPLTNTVTPSDFQLGTSKAKKGIRVVIFTILAISSVGFLTVIIISQSRRKKSD